jgi:hypothetical protein
MGNKRMDGYPEMAMVRRFLETYVDRFHTRVEAAKKIGTSASTLCKWMNGVEPIPEWLCDYLGFQKQWIYVGKAGVTPTDLAQVCLLAKEDRRHQGRTV